jgi:hypothetical protein
MIYRSETDLAEVSDDATPEQVITALNKVITGYSHALKTLSIQANFDGFIAENVVIKATSKVSIQHFLGVKPKWRILLRQVGNGVITDIPSEWNDKVITLYNNGAVEVTLAVFIARE